MESLHEHYAEERLRVSYSINWDGDDDFDDEDFDDDYFENGHESGIPLSALPQIRETMKNSFGLPRLDDDSDADLTQPIHNEGRKVGRNDPCPCGSGKKYKKCCLKM